MSASTKGERASRHRPRARVHTGHGRSEATPMCLCACARAETGHAAPISAVARSADQPDSTPTRHDRLQYTRLTFVKHLIVPRQE